MLSSAHNNNNMHKKLPSSRVTVGAINDRNQARYNFGESIDINAPVSVIIATCKIQSWICDYNNNYYIGSEY